MSNPTWDGDWQSDSIWLTKELADARAKFAALKEKHERLTNAAAEVLADLSGRCLPVSKESESQLAAALSESEEE